MDFISLQKSYWCPSPAKDNQISPMTNGFKLHDTNKEYFEAEPTDLDAGIMVNGLRKEFKGITGGHVIAVDSVSFKVRTI